MKLEKIAIWRETGLFSEQADESRGYLGLCAEHLPEMRSALTQDNCIFRQKHSIV